MSSSSTPSSGYRIMQVTPSEAEIEAEDNPSLGLAIHVMDKFEPGIVFIASPYAIKDNSENVIPVSMSLLFDSAMYSKEDIYGILSKTAEGILDQIVSEEVNKTDD